MTRPALYYLPDVLTVLRFPMAAAFLLVEDTRARIALVAAASISDWLDGLLARRREHGTSWGALLDPIADKTFVLSALLAFVIEGALSLGQLLIILARDIATAVGFIVAWLMPTLRASSFKARYPGKVVTVLQLLVLFALLVAPGAVWWLVLATGVASAVAIADYTLELVRQRARARRTA
ncbi:MAG TPA: CDP-alcohol phosphatidyltransferase family protein [Gemmatimonadaceae bacterium]|nr:CDP-alcohol phosphatidyltransferase family protein [Gemmatimonadaceae bacterium]